LILDAREDQVGGVARETTLLHLAIHHLRDVRLCAHRRTAPRVAKHHTMSGRRGDLRDTRSHCTRADDADATVRAEWHLSSLEHWLSLLEERVDALAIVVGATGFALQLLFIVQLRVEVDAQRTIEPTLDETERARRLQCERPRDPMSLLEQRVG